MTKVCPHCFDNKGLQRRIVDVRPHHPDGRCEFHPRFKGIPITAVAEIVDVVFRNNYGFGHYHPVLDDMAGENLFDILYSLTGAEDDRVRYRHDSLVLHRIEEATFRPERFLDLAEEDFNF